MPELLNARFCGFDLDKTTLIGLVVCHYFFVLLADLLIRCNHIRQVLPASCKYIKSMSLLDCQVFSSTELAKTNHAATCMSIYRIDQSQPC